MARDRGARASAPRPSLEGTTGQLVLTPGVTVADMNILDVYGNGGYEQEVFGVDDSRLLKHPPLIQPVNKAKQLIVQLAGL